MTIPLSCLLGFAFWTLAVLVVGIGYPRVSQVLRGEAKSSSFPADTPHGSDSYRRTMRAHANCIENLPVFAAVVVTGELAGVRSGAMDTLAIVYLGARVCQTVLHIASGRARVINLRFLFFCIQLACVAAMGGLILAG